LSCVFIAFDADARPRLIGHFLSPQWTEECQQVILKQVEGSFSASNQGATDRNKIRRSQQTARKARSAKFLIDTPFTAVRGIDAHQPAHPVVFMLLIAPNGAMQGYVSVAIIGLLARARIPVVAIVRLVAPISMPHSLKFLWSSNRLHRPIPDLRHRRQQTTRTYDHCAASRLYQNHHTGAPTHPIAVMLEIGAQNEITGACKFADAHR
jgi:hypothetical protein